jgi:hypothetical protein
MRRSLTMNEESYYPPSRSSTALRWIPAGFVADALDPTAELLFARWKRAVDILWRESVRARQPRLAERERARAAKRRKNLKRIVRKALDDYRKIELERASWTSRRSARTFGVKCVRS